MFYFKKNQHLFYLSSNNLRNYSYDFPNFQLPYFA